MARKRTAHAKATRSLGEILNFPQAGVRSLGRRAAEVESPESDDYWRALVELRAMVDAEIDGAVTARMAAGFSWGEIGAVMGMTSQGARKRWGSDDVRTLRPVGGQRAGVR